jgi:thiamine pyrophosphokinase
LRAVILANGRLSDPSTDRARVRPDDWILAADGGLHNARRLGLTPAVVIGDLDSVGPDDLAPLDDQGVTVVRHPERKDETDLELALAYAVRHGADEILVLGALGDRWDQTLANALLLALPVLARTRTWLVDGSQQVTLLRGSQSLSLHGAPGDTLSLLPLAGDAHGVTTDGLEYPLKNETLRFAATRGVSNTLLDPAATVRLAEGLLWVAHGGPTSVKPKEDVR